MAEYSYYRVTHAEYDELRRKDHTIAQYLWHGEYDWEDDDQGDWIMRIPNTAKTFILRIELSDRITGDYLGESAE